MKRSEMLVVSLEGVNQGIWFYLVLGVDGPRLPAPLQNFSFDSFFLICAYFVFRDGGIVWVIYLLFCLANHGDPCKRRVVAALMTKRHNI